MKKKRLIKLIADLRESFPWDGKQHDSIVACPEECLIEMIKCCKRNNLKNILK